MKYQNNWHLLSSEEVLDRLSVDKYKGLSREEAKKRRRRYGSNSVWRVRRTSPYDAALATVFDIATLFLIVSSVFAAAFDRKYEAGAIIMILIIGGVLRAVTYIRANRILEDMARSKIPVTSVIRDGKVSLVSASEIVPGDIVFLDSGDTVPCDGRVLSGEDSVVSERGITENKTPVHKFDTVIETKVQSGEVPCEFRSNMLFAGSVVISGTFRIAATSCGSQTLISMKQGGIELTVSDKIPVIEKLGVRSRNTSLVMLACVMLFTVLSIFSGDVLLSDTFLCTMSMAVAAMSEFLTTIGYIIIAVTLRDSADESKAKKKGTSRILIREPDGIEKLAQTDRIVFCGSSFFKSGRAELLAYRSSSEYVGIDSEYPEANSPERIISLAMSASSASYGGVTAGGGGYKPSPRAALVMTAADAYTRKTGKAMSYDYAALDHADSDSHAAAGLDTSLILLDGETWAVSCGAIDDVMRCCTSYETKDGAEPLTEEMIRKIFTECANLEFGGAKVIAVSMRPSQFNTLNRLSTLTQYMKFVGFFAISQEAEKNAAENVEYMKKSGIVPIMFTENPDSDLYYCHRLGLFGKKTKIIHASALTREAADSADENGIIVSFDGIEPNYIAGAYSRAMKLFASDAKDKKDKNSRDGYRITVAAGRETYESGVISKADIGFSAAQSKFRSVPEILAKNSAVIVHTGEETMAEYGGLDGIIGAVRAARRALSNIESAKSYLTASQCARLVLILAAVLFGVPLLSPVFILIWGLIFDFAAVLVMAFENSSEFVSPHKDKPDEESGGLLRGNIGSTLKAVIFGIVWGAILAVTVFLAGILLPEAAGAKTYLTASVVLSVLVCSAGIVKKDGIYITKQHTSTAGAMFALMSALSALMILFTPFGADAADGEVCSAIAAVPAMIPALVLLAAFSVFRAVSAARKNKT